MMRFVLPATLALLSACAAPAPEPLRTGGAEADAAIMAEPMVEEAPSAAPDLTTETCDDPGDGIGGTGCPVE